MFSWANKWKHANFGRNKTSVELAQKSLTNLHCKFYLQHENKKTSSTVKEPLSTGESFSKKIAQCLLKNIRRGLLHDGCRLLSFQSNPWTKFAWCQLGKVRSASSCEASFLDLDRSCFLADVDCHFFRSISVNNIFFPRWSNVFLAE